MDRLVNSMLPAHIPGVNLDETNGRALAAYSACSTLNGSTRHGPFSFFLIILPFQYITRRALLLGHHQPYRTGYGFKVFDTWCAI